MVLPESELRLTFFSLMTSGSVGSDCWSLIYVKLLVDSCPQSRRLLWLKGRSSFEPGRTTRFNARYGNYLQIVEVQRTFPDESPL